MIFPSVLYILLQFLFGRRRPIYIYFGYIPSVEFGGTCASTVAVEARFSGIFYICFLFTVAMYKIDIIPKWEKLCGMVFSSQKF